MRRSQENGESKFATALSVWRKDIEFIESHLNKLKENISKVLVGKEDKIDFVLTSLVAGGHVLLEDVPGTGKTMLANIVAKELKGCVYTMYEIATMIRQSYTAKAEKSEESNEDNIDSDSELEGHKATFAVADEEEQTKKSE